VRELVEPYFKAAEAANSPGLACAPGPLSTELRDEAEAPPILLRRGEKRALAER